jgi:hypothetical protein
VELEAATDQVLGDYLDQLNAGEYEPKWHIAKLAAVSASGKTEAAVNSGLFAVAAHSVSIVRFLNDVQP